MGRVSSTTRMGVSMMGTGGRIRCMAEVIPIRVFNYFSGILFYASGKPAYDGEW